MSELNAFKLATLGTLWKFILFQNHNVSFKTKFADIDTCKP